MILNKLDNIDIQRIVFKCFVLKLNMSFNNTSNKPTTITVQLISLRVSTIKKSILKP